MLDLVRVQSFSKMSEHKSSHLALSDKSKMSTSKALLKCGREDGELSDFSEYETISVSDDDCQLVASVPISDTDDVCLIEPKRWEQNAEPIEIDSPDDIRTPFFNFKLFESIQSIQQVIKRKVPKKTRSAASKSFKPKVNTHKVSDSKTTSDQASSMFRRPHTQNIHRVTSDSMPTVDTSRRRNVNRARDEHHNSQRAARQNASKRNERNNRRRQTRAHAFEKRRSTKSPINSIEEIPIRLHSPEPCDMIRPTRIEDEDENILQLRLIALQSKQELLEAAAAVALTHAQDEEPTKPLVDSVLESDEEMTLEEKELRLIALKSAMYKKHEARKKRRKMMATHSVTTSSNALSLPQFQPISPITSDNSETISVSNQLVPALRQTHDDFFAMPPLAVPFHLSMPLNLHYFQLQNMLNHSYLRYALNILTNKHRNANGLTSAPRFHCDNVRNNNIVIRTSNDEPVHSLAQIGKSSTNQCDEEEIALRSLLLSKTKAKYINLLNNRSAVVANETTFVADAVTVAVVQPAIEQNNLSQATTDIKASTETGLVRSTLKRPSSDKLSSLVALTAARRRASKQLINKAIAHVNAKNAINNRQQELHKQRLVNAAKIHRIRMIGKHAEAVSTTAITVVPSLPKALPPPPLAPPAVQRLVIHLGGTSDSDSDSDIDERDRDTFDRPKRSKTSLSNRIDESTTTVNLNNNNFEKRLDAYLHSIRKTAALPLPLATTPPLSSQRSSAKTASSPIKLEKSVVQHLPKSQQAEYKRLIQRMLMLEKQKTGSK